MEYLELHKKARIYAAYKGYPELCEDFAQEIVMKRIEGIGLKQSMAQAFIDYLRSQFGRIGTPRNEFKYKERRTYVSLDILRMKELGNGN